MKEEKLILMEKFFDAELNEAQLEELLLILDEDAARREFLLILKTKGLTYAAMHKSTDKLEESILEKISQEDTDLLADNILNQIQSFPEPKKTKPFPTHWLIVAAALVLATAIPFILAPKQNTVIVSQQNTPAKPVVIAKIENSEGFNFIVRDGEKINLKGSENVYSNDLLYIQDQSQAQLIYNDGSQLSFAPGTYIRISEEDQQKTLELFSGHIYADIQKQAPNKEMIILTEHSRCEVLGTAFTISSSDVSSLLDVEHGKVKIIDLKQKTDTIVSTDEFANVNGENTVRSFPKNKALFKSDIMTKHTTQTVDISVDLPPNSDTLYLAVTNGGDNNRFDHAAWLKPELHSRDHVLDLCKEKFLLQKSGAYSIRRNRGYDNNTLNVADQKYKTGITTHSTSIIAFKIPAGYTRFTAKGALLNSGLHKKDSVTSLRFEVYTEIPKETLDKLLIRRSHY